MIFLLPLFLLISNSAFATTGADGMALMLMCQTYTVLTGTIGLMFGFVIAAYGLYLLIIKGTYTYGLIVIILGALLTALPGLVISTLKGANSLLEQTGVNSGENYISEVLDSVTDYASSDSCDQIMVDLAQYNSLMDVSENFDPASANSSSGQGIIGPSDDTDIPEISDSDPTMGQQSPCFGKVIDTSRGVVPRKSSDYGNRIHPIFKTKRLHAGVDIAVPTGTPVLAFQGGKVVRSDPRVTGYGNYICIQHDATKKSCYAHLSRRNVMKNQSVSAGQVIGLAGSTGVSSGPHLHFEIRINGRPTDPKRDLGCGG